MAAAIGEETYSSLLGKFKGDLLRPGDAVYEAARSVWNGMFRRKPALIARCAGVSDVQHAIQAAREIGLVTAIRCGGHSLAGFSTCDGMVIDLSRMREVTQPANKRTTKAKRVRNQSHGRSTAIDERWRRCLTRLARRTTLPRPVSNRQGWKRPRRRATSSN